MFTENNSMGERDHTHLLRHSLMLFRHHVCILYTLDFGQVLRLYPFNCSGQLLKCSLLKIRTFCLVRTAFMMHSSLFDSFVCKPAKKWHSILTDQSEGFLLKYCQNACPGKKQVVSVDARPATASGNYSVRWI